MKPAIHTFKTAKRHNSLLFRNKSSSKYLSLINYAFVSLSTMLILIFIFFIIFSSENQAQNFLVSSQNLSTEDGLSSRFTYSTFKDRDGFIWIGTSFGLNRYDGNTVKTYSPATCQITDKHIKDLHQDDQGNIWVCNVAWYDLTSIYKRIDILNPSTNEALPFDSIIPPTSGLSRASVSALFTTKKQVIFIGTNDGLLFQYKDQKIRKFPFQFPQTPIYKVLCSDATIWVKTEQQIWKFSLDGKLQSQTAVAEQSGMLGLDSLQQLWWWEKIKDQIIIKHFDRHQELQEFTHPSLELVPNSAETVSRYKSILINPNDNTIWCQTSTHLNILSVEQGLIHQFKKSDFALTKRQGRVLLPIPDIYFDEQNIAWISTNKGISKIILEPNYFQRNLSNHSTRGILPLNDSLTIVASYSGLKKISQQQTSNFKNIVKSIALEGLTLIETPNSGKIFIGSGHNVLAEYDPSSDLFEFDSIPPLHLELNSFAPGSFDNYLILQFAFTNFENKLWIGTNVGLFWYDYTSKTFHFFKDYSKFPLFKQATIYDLKVINEELWIASSKGLFLMDSEQDIVQHWSTTSQPALPFEILLHIHPDKKADEVLWLATKGGGILRFDTQQKTIDQFTTKNGLSHDLTYSIYEDASNHLWISSNYGLMRFDKKSYLVDIFLPKDGLPHEEFNRGSHAEAADGKLFFGGLNGIVSFYPKDIANQPPIQAPLRITNYQQFDGHTGKLLNRTNELLASNQIILAPEDKFFTLSFALLDYKNKKTKTYAYKIEPYDSDWTYNNTSTIRVNDLPPGSYTLTIKGQTTNGQWAPNPLKINIEVLIPFYKKWWFILLSILVGILAIWVYTRWRLRQLKLREEELSREVTKRTLQIEADKKIIEEQAHKLKELDLAKSHFFANISHELRTPLTLILGPIESITAKDFEQNLPKIKKILQSTKRNSHQLKTLIEELLELSKLESKQLEIKEEATLLFSYIQQLCGPFEAQAQLSNIEFQLNYTLDKKLWVALDQLKVEKIINNLLSNAVKYSLKEGQICIILSQVNDQLLVAVQDSGKGIAPKDLPYVFNRHFRSFEPASLPQDGSGIGLALANELASFLEGSLTVESQLNEGSCFKLRLPLKVVAAPPIINTIEKIPKQIEAFDAAKQAHYSILIVEDHPEMAAYIADILQPFYEIQTANNGLTALEHIHQSQQLPDLIVSDWMMPTMTGFQFLNNLKTTESLARIPFVMLTAKGSQQDKLQALALGVDDYLVKPFSAPELLIRIQNLLKRSQQRQDWLEESEIEKDKAIESVDGKWLLEFKNIVLGHIQDSQLGISLIAGELHISERQLHRRIKTLTGLTPNKYIREIKLQIARTALEKKEFQTINEYAYYIGFKNVNHFSKVYQERFGKKPSEYL